MSTSISETAQTIFQRAYENRYTWDEFFPGYTADLLFQDDQTTCKVNVVVSAELQSRVEGAEDIQLTEFVNKHLWDIVTHRKRSNFSQAHGKNIFSIGEVDDSGSVEIFVTGESMGSHYRVRGDIISQVSRQMGGLSFTIDTIETLQTEDGYLPTVYKAVFRDATTGNIKANRQHIDSYEKVGRYYIPSRQIINSIDDQGKTRDSVFQFNNINLLST